MVGGLTVAGRKHDDPQRLTPEAALAIYKGLGPRRSLRATMREADTMGLIVPARSTITRWSARDRWVEQARQYDRERAAASSTVLVDRVLASDSEHSEFFRRARTLAFEALGRIIDAEAKPPMSVLDAVKVGEVAVRMERLIDGRSTEIVEVLSSTLGVLTDEVGPSVARMADAFEVAVEQHVHDPVERAAVLRALMSAKVAFAQRYDDLIAAMFTSRGLSIEALT